MLIRLISVFLCISFSLHAIAEPIDLYRAVVPVTSQTAKERSRAAQEGLQQVLIRVSGVRDVTSSAGVKRNLPKSSTYLEQYSYQIDRLENGDKQEQMLMTFSAAQVRRVLSEAALPVWPTNRPKVLLWLVNDHVDTGKQFVSGFDSPVAIGLQRAARARGLPLAFPLMDLDDQLALTEQQVWSLDEHSILVASERYGVDTILVGRYTQTSQGQWLGTWQFFHLGQTQLYDLRASEGGTLGEDALNPLADYLSERYSVTTNTEGGSQFYVQISQIDDFRSYRSALNYLERLAVVSDFKMVSISGDRMLMGVQLAGDLNQLNNALSLDGKLSPESGQNSGESVWRSGPAGTMEQPLSFLWIGN